MAQQYISGASAPIVYAYEDADAYQQVVGSHTASNATYVPFGYGIEYSVTANNNSERVYGTGARNAAANLKLGYQGTLSVNGVVSNAYWLLGTLGANADGGSAGSYTHTYTETNALPSFTTKIGYDLATDKLRTLLGCVVNSLTLSCAVGEPVRFSIDAMYRYESTTSASQANVADTEPIFTFAHGVLQIPSGTTLAAVQNIEITIVNTIEMIYGTGSRFPVGFVAKQREYNFRLTAAVKDATLMSRFYDGSTGTVPHAGSGTEIASLILTFTNDDGDIILMTLAGVEFAEHTLPGNVNEVVKEDITGWARSCTNIVYTSDIQNAPAEATNI